MNFIPTTIGGFFSRSKVQYKIPSFQRAYAWGVPQLEQFLIDLYEHKNSSENNPYFYGNILLQTIKKDKEYYIIDGQQRLTTISIFVRVVLNEIKRREIVDEDLSIEDEERIYFKDFGKIKLRPVEYDQSCYDTLIIENEKTFNCITSSQKKMKKAKEYFTAKLRDAKEISNADLLNMYHTLNEAKLNCIELTGNKEAALMFELQNNRGKDLTNLEKLKSFFMYQMYIYSTEYETESNIDYISQKFEPIYKIANDLNEILLNGEENEQQVMLNEDNVLLYHSYAYSKKHFGYRNIGDIIDEFKFENEDKVQWIKNYVDELYNTFTNIKKILSNKNIYLTKLKRLGMPKFVYPFIIKGMKYIGDDKDKMNELFIVLEKISFRHKLIVTRADIQSRLNDVIKNFNGNVEELKIEIKAKMNDSYYWSDIKFEETLKGYMFQNPVLHYLLWEYEESLHNKGYKFGDINVIDESIEHISPQTTKDEWVEAGYEVDENNSYTQYFIDNYLNSLGNLMIISKSHNSSIGNKPFIDKLTSYKKDLLMRQQMEIETFVNTENPIWNSEAIKSRTEKIISFAIKRWSY